LRGGGVFFAIPLQSRTVQKADLSDLGFQMLKYPFGGTVMPGGDENVEAAVSQTGFDTRLPVGLLYRQDLAENAGIGLHTLLGQLPVDGLADPFCPVLIRIDQLALFQRFNFRLKGFLPLLQLLEIASDLKFLLIQGIFPLPKQLFHGGELLRLPLLRQLLNGIRHLFGRKCSSAVGQLSIEGFQLLFGVL
jgi:hypothetical protein